MALRYDVNSLTAKQVEGDPSVFMVTLDITNDADATIPNDWEKRYTTITVRWNNNMNAAQFAAAVQAAYAAAQTKTSETALVTALQTAFSAYGKAFVRNNPSPTPGQGSDASHPLFVKVVT